MRVTLNKVETDLQDIAMVVAYVTDRYCNQDILKNRFINFIVFLLTIKILYHVYICFSELSVSSHTILNRALRFQLEPIVKIYRLLCG